MQTTTSEIRLNKEVIAAVRALEARNGRLDTADVVDAARNPDSPLHGYFEWDDSAAAEAYRLSQAETLIRRFKIVVTVENVPVRCRRYASIPVAGDTQGRTYYSVPKLRERQADAALLDYARRILGNVEAVLALASVKGGTVGPKLKAAFDGLPDSLRAIIDETHRDERNL